MRHLWTKAQRAKQKAFTLIELIVVIVILAILAAFAIPRFASLATDAREATVDGMVGTLYAAANLAHSLQIAAAASASTSVTMEGTTVTMANAYPTADAAGIAAAIQDTSGFTTATVASVFQFRANGATTPASCFAGYAAAASLGAAPTVTSTKSGC